MSGVEPIHFVNIDVGIFSLRYNGTSNPPVGAWKPRGQIRPGSGLSVLLLVTGLRLHFAVGGLPQPNAAVIGTKHHGVVPPPDHRFGTIWSDRNGHEMPR